MPTKKEINECCGVDYFYGFAFSKDKLLDWMKKTFDSPEPTPDTGWDMFKKTLPSFNLTNESYFFRAGPGMYLLFLDDKQEVAFKDILEKYDFKQLVPPFKNPRMKNLTKVTIYGRLNTIDWYSKFMTEEASDIWKKNALLS